MRGSETGDFPPTREGDLGLCLGFRGAFLGSLARADFEGFFDFVVEPVFDRVAMSARKPRKRAKANESAWSRQAQLV
jgi:hypothetical protein